ncbi:MAG: hypothetical protein WA827_18490, partial [Candidatus Binatus sp.]
MHSPFLISPGTSPVVIDYLDVCRVALLPHETDSILFIDSNAVLPDTATLQGFQMIASRSREIPELERRIQRFQFPPRRSLDMPQRRHVPLIEQSLCAGVAKALDHNRIV